MSGKQIVLQAIHGECPARNAAALLSANVWTVYQFGYALEDLVGKPQLAAELALKAQERLRSDIVWPASSFGNLAIRALGGDIRFRRLGASEVVASLVQHPNEVAQLPLEKINEDEAIRALREVTATVAAALGDDALIGTNIWGPFTLAGHLYGVDRLMRSLYRDRVGAHQLISVANEICYRFLAPFTQAGVEIFSVGDPSASGDLISRAQYETFVQPYHQTLFSRLHALGAFIQIHICGNTTNRIDLMLDAGADIISVDYKVDLAHVQSVVAGRAAFAGNLDPVGVLRQATPEQVAQAAHALLERVGQDGNFILMPGCDIPHDVPLENIRALIETAHAWHPHGGGVNAVPMPVSA